MLSSGQDLKCWSQSRSWDAVTRTRIKMLKSKQELKISNLFFRGSVSLEGKMNDKRMISQTPMAHKLDVLSLVDSLRWERKRVACHAWKYVRDSEEESVKKRECALSCWLVCPTASKWGSKERVKMVSAAFYFARGGDPGRMPSVILIGRNT